MIVQLSQLFLLLNFVRCSFGNRGGSLDDNIPVIEIRGEGAPMSSAQIRHLEEMDNGGPLDIKIEKTFVPARCPQHAKRLDFVTFHYKVFTEDMKKVHQSYGANPVTIQLGTGMVMPGLDKAIRGMCDDELRKVSVPYRLSRKSKSRVWKNIPNDENWLIFNLEMVQIQPYTLDLQFSSLDLNNNTKLDFEEIVEVQKRLKKEFGKSWKNEDIDNIAAAKYYIRYTNQFLYMSIYGLTSFPKRGSYFDINNDGLVTKEEWIKVMNRDETQMKENNDSKVKGRKRDPGVAWILDFNNDGIVSYKELDSADELLELGPKILPTGIKDEL